MTQLRPRLTSAWMSPWVATTRPSLTATMTPQPVPQNRQGALFQLSCGLVARHDDVGGLGRQGDPGNRRGGGGGLRLDDVATGELPWLSLPQSGWRAARSGGRRARPTARRAGRGSSASRSTMPRSLAVSSVTTILPAALAPWTSTPSSAARCRRDTGPAGPGGHGRGRLVMCSSAGIGVARRRRGRPAPMAATGQAATQSPQPVQRLGVDLGPRHPPEHRRKARSHLRGRRRRSCGRATPRAARQPAAMRTGSCRGTDPPRSSPRREMAAGAPRIAVTARAGRVGRR